jgi:hypothetical protein
MKRSERQRIAKEVRLTTLRELAHPPNRPFKVVPPCDHLRVSIRRIIRARRHARDSRVIGGHCDDCGATVSRTQSPKEITTTHVPGKWQ